MQAEEEASGTSAAVVADLASSDDPRAIARLLRERQQLSRSEADAEGKKRAVFDSCTQRLEAG